MASNQQTEHDITGDAEEENLEEEFNDNGEEEIPDLPPDHPLIKKLQDELKTHLEQLDDKLDVELRDKIAYKSKLAGEREEIGVQLYSVQQQLAKLQTQLTQYNEQKAAYEAQRLEEESMLKEDQNTFQNAEKEFKDREKEYETQRNELDKLNEVVIRLEKYNQETASQVAVIRRETYKSEQSATETELSKQEQDMYIDRLTNQIKTLHSEMELLEAQIQAQRIESKTARDALLQSSLEMEKINFERNQLIQDWKSSLIGIKLRSKTLSDLEAASSKQEETIRALQNEQNGIKAQIKDQQELNERNRGLQNKIQNRIQFLKNKIEQTKESREKLQETLKGLYSLIAEKEAYISRLIIDRNSAKGEYKLSQKGANEISNRIHEIEDQIIAHVTDQSNLKRDAIAAQSMIQRIREQIEQKDRELSDIQNEVMRLQIDHLNIGEQCQKFERALKDIVEELQAKDNLIAQYESQIRRNNVEIEKRQSEVDKLNRRYDDLVSAQNGEEYGPLERKIRQIQSKIQQTEEAAQENQALWLKKQTELVNLQKSCDEVENANVSQQAHIAVLSRKRDRTRNFLTQTEREIEKLQIQIRLLQREMSRLGEQLSSSVGAGSNLVEGNVNFEAEILEVLRRKEEEAAFAERQIEEVANKREELAEELMETEKSIMMWEKKLQLAREMKEALDPNYGASELKAMKKEVSRMELRLNQIKKQQENIVKEMEFALKRRKTIADRGAVQKRLNKDKTRADVVKGITELKRQAKHLNNETGQFDKNIEQDVEVQRELGAEIEQLAHIMRESQLKKAEIEVSIKNEEKSKLLHQTRLEKLHQKSRLFQNTSQKTLLKSTDAFESSFANVKHQESQLISLLDSLSNEFPHLAENFQIAKDKLFSV